MEVGVYREGKMFYWDMKRKKRISMCEEISFLEL